MNGILLPKPDKKRTSRIKLQYADHSENCSLQAVTGPDIPDFSDTSTTKRAMRVEHAETTLIFDGDDTLWRTMPLYSRAKREFFALMGATGFDSATVEESFERRDIANVAYWGFTVDRFRRSMVETLHEFLEAAGKDVPPALEERVSNIATSVARRKARNVPGARAVLAQLRPSYGIVLLTKGEQRLQERRVSESGLGEYFQRVFIVQHKDELTFLRVLSDLGLRPEDCWSIGDSLRSDIKPALTVGMGAIWIPQFNWGYESVSEGGTGRLIRLLRITELPRALRKVGAVR